MLRLRLPVMVGFAGLALLSTSAGASVSPGTITSQSAWSTLATLAPGVTVSRKTVTVSGYSGARTLTRISWTLGNSHVALDASPVVPGAYGGSQHSFAEGRISSYGASTSALAGINGDTFCSGCAANGGDTLHGLLVHSRQIYANGRGPEVGYTAGGGMIMGSARALPVIISLPKVAATVAVWNALSIPGKTIGADQVAVLSQAGAKFSIPSSSTALVLAGSISAYGGTSTVGAQFRNMLRMAVPYQDSADRVKDSAGKQEWVNAYRVSQTAGTPVSVAMPVSGRSISGSSVTVPASGVVLVARNGTAAAKGLVAAAARATVSVALDDQGWNAATSIMDGKFQMVSGGVAKTKYPGWPDSWPWSCQGTGSGCVRAVVAENGAQGWLMVEAAGSHGLTMPDFARVLAQLGATDAMGFDSNTHADFWRAGGGSIDSSGYEPGVPEATMLRYH